MTEGEEALLRRVAELEEQLKTKDREAKAKDNEIARLRKQPTGNIGFVDEGSMEWKVEVKDVGKDFIFSPYTLIGGAHFRIACKAETRSRKKHLALFLRKTFRLRRKSRSEDSGEKQLEVRLFCNDGGQPESKTFAATAIFSVTLTSPTTPYALNSSSRLFQPTKNHWGYPKFIKLAAALDPSKGFVQNGHITVKAEIKLSSYYKNAIIDFASPDPLQSDVTLLIEGKEYHANKMSLSKYSGYFKVLFCSDFAEKSEKRFELHDIGAKEFEELLHFISPERKKISAENVAGLLRMADFFDVESVQRECTAFLIACADLSLMAKLQLSEEFRLSELQNHLLEGMESAESIKVVLSHPDFTSLSDRLRIHLLEKQFYSLHCVD